MDEKRSTREQQAIPSDPAASGSLLTLAPPSLIMDVVSAPTLVILEAMDPSLVGRRFTVTERELVVGREPGMAIVLSSERGVSRRHTRFYLRGQVVLCADEKSTNGTYVNERKIDREVALSSGDRIRIGPVVIAFLAAEQSSRPGVSAVLDSLPFPMAALHPAALAHDGAMARVRAILDGIEMGVRFLAAVELAAVRRVGEAGGAAAKPVADGLHELLRRRVPLDRPLSMGSWEALLWELSRLAPRPTSGSEPIFEVAQAFVKKKGERSELAERIQSAVGYRNKAFGHGATLAEEAYGKEEPWLMETLERLVLASCPLSRLRLVSVVKIDLVDGEDDAFRYTLRSHRGPLDRFPSSEMSSRARLRKEWCFLFDEGAGLDAEPLPLGPVVCAKVASESGQIELFLADGLTFGPKGAKISARGVVSSHHGHVTVPWGRAEEAFFTWLMA